MSESTSSPEPVTGPIDTTTTPVTTTSEPPRVVETRDVDKRRRGGKVNVVAAWVGIAAGTVFIVAVVFFTGFVLGMSAGGGHHGGHHRDGGGQMMHHERGPGPGWPGGPGGFGPGGPGGPGGFGPGGQGGPQGGPGQQTQPSR